MYVVIFNVSAIYFVSKDRGRTIEPVKLRNDISAFRQ